MSDFSLSAAQVAEIAGGTLVGEVEMTLTGVASLMEAEPRHISFLGNTKYKPKVKHSQAGIILVPADYEDEPVAGQAFVKCDNPSAVFSEFVVMFAPPEWVPKPGLHPSAIIPTGMEVPASTHIGAHVVIQEGATIGEDVIIEAGCYIGHGVSIGEGTRLHPNVTIRERCLIGQHVVIQSGTVIGSDGFGFELAEAGHTKIPQTGIVQIDDHVDLGACVTVDRARFGRTWIKSGAKIDNLVQIAHNVIIGENCVIVAQVGIAGSTSLGRHVILAGQAGLPGHVHIGDGAIIMAKSGPMGDVEPGVKLMGIPGVPSRDFMRQTAYLHRLPEMAGEVKALQKKLAELEQKVTDAEQ